MYKKTATKFLLCLVWTKRKQVTFKKLFKFFDLLKPIFCIWSDHIWLINWSRCTLMERRRNRNKNLGSTSLNVYIPTKIFWRKKWKWKKFLLEIVLWNWGNFPDFEGSFLYQVLIFGFCGVFQQNDLIQTYYKFSNFHAVLVLKAGILKK